MKRATILAAIVGLGLGGVAGAFAFFAWPMLNRGGALATPSHPLWTEVQWSLPERRMGQGQGLSMRGGRLWS